MNKILIISIFLVLLSSISDARNVTCNRNIDQFAPDHYFFTGYLDVGINDPITGLGFVFYSKKYAFTPEEIASYPTLIWLNGGPGSSSMEGAYFENGPYRVLSVNGTETIVENQDSWTNKYNVLFIDQPIAVGFSRSANNSNLPTNEVEVAQQFYKGLASFYSQNGCYNSSIFLESPLFLTGESYAGKYIPNIAQEILQQNLNQTQNGGLVIPLTGVSIGDPLTDPQHQLYKLSEFGLANNLISNQTASAINQQLLLMKLVFKTKDYTLASSIYDSSINYFMSNSLNGNLSNVYNFKIGPYPDDFVGDHCENYIKNFGFDQDFVYSSTSYLISESLSRDTFSPNGIPALQYILSQQLPVLIYNGDNDILINTPGVTDFVNSFEWSGHDVFSTLPLENITVEVNGASSVIGKYKSYENFHFATIADAGHLVPFDQPESMNIILGSFIESLLETNGFQQTEALQY